MHTPFVQNEKALLTSVAAGDEMAFRELFDAYRNRLYFFIVRLTNSNEIAEDILQDTFLKIWLYREKLKQVDHFDAWLFRIAQNSVFTALRRMAVEANILASTQPVGAPAPNPDEQLHYKQVTTAIQQAVDALPPQQKKVYLLRREEGQSIQQIASIMNISGLTVKKHLTAAQKAIRQTLETSFPDDWAILLIIWGLLNR